MKTPLHTCRKAADISLENLAKSCNTSVATLSRIERGLSKNTSGATCLALMNQFNGFGLELEHLINPSAFPDFKISLGKGKNK
ncbi:helix-turn-helix domain-containing protein [Vibrio metschnikovii]|nr:helix-turn-helix domain-containing protein [Vibrio metschnikovii]